MIPTASSPEPSVTAAVEAACQPVTIPAGSILFRPGELCRQFPIIEAGTIKVVRTAVSGRQILLYQVGPGQSCILSTACLLATEVFAARAKPRRM